MVCVVLYLKKKKKGKRKSLVKQHNKTAKCNSFHHYTGTIGTGYWSYHINALIRVLTLKG